VKNMKATSECPRTPRKERLGVAVLLAWAVLSMLVDMSLAQAQSCRVGPIVGFYYPPDGATDVSRTTPLVDPLNLPDQALGEGSSSLEPEREWLFEEGANTSWVPVEPVPGMCSLVFLPVEPLKPNQRYELRTDSGEAYNPFVTGEEAGGPELSVEVGPDLDPSEVLEVEVEASRPVVVVALGYAFPYDENRPTRSGHQTEFVALDSGKLRSSVGIPEEGVTATFVGVEGQVTDVSVTNDRPPEETEADSDDEGGCTCALRRTRQRSLSWGVLAAMGLVLTARRRRRGRW
jgi:hypothetical protein